MISQAGRWCRLRAGPRPFTAARAAGAQRRASSVAHAKAKGGGGGKKGSQKKGGGALSELLKKKEMAASDAAAAAAGDGLARHDQYASPDVLLHLLSICQSYWKHYGE